MVADSAPQVSGRRVDFGRLIGTGRLWRRNRSAIGESGAGSSTRPVAEPVAWSLAKSIAHTASKSVARSTARAVTEPTTRSASSKLIWAKLLNQVRPNRESDFRRRALAPQSIQFLDQCEDCQWPRLRDQWATRRLR